MSPHNDGGPAFPLGQYVIINGVPFTQPTNGMSLRDYLAAQAITSDWMGDHSIYEQAELAYKVADAMLAERAKKDHTETNFGMKKEAQP